MAKESNDISDIVKKCKILVLDIEGTTTSISFVKDKLFPYVEENVKEFLGSQWDQDDVKEAVTALRKLALEDKEKSVEGVVAIPGDDASKEDQIEGLVNNVKWQMSLDRKVAALKQLQGLIWKKGYDKGDIKGHIYEDVLPAIEQWRATEGQKVYIYSSGSVQAQKLLFGQSTAGDMLALIDGHFDTAVGAKQEAASYAAIVEKIGCKPEEILFLTDIEKEGEAARTSGLNVALVSREGNAPLSAEATASFPVLHSFAQLTISNKRKPDVAQDEQPAKVPKTDTENDVKTTTEEVELLETKVTVAVAEKVVEEPEKMEVEEEAVVKDPEETKLDVPESIASVVAVIAPTKDSSDTGASAAEAVVVEEKVEKTDKIETEKMETEPAENVGTVTEPDEVVKSVEEKAQIAEETPPTIITEIEDISDDKQQSLNEVAEIIEDLQPVIEEPSTVEDMERLQNVGEVLEKECDEILSKVQDVTNLDTIPLKPLLNTIAEETMETENIDSNDIVDRILDTEIELGMKPCEDIDLNTVEKITDEKPVTEEESVKEQKSASEIIPAEKHSEPIVEQIDVVKKDEKRSPTEVEVDKSKEVVETNDTAVASEVKLDENKMETEDSKADTVENKVVTESKMDAEDSKVLSEDNKTEDGSKIQTVASKVDNLENKIETETKMDAEEIKVETEESTIVKESKMDQEEIKIENKTEPDSKIIADASKVEAVGDKDVGDDEKESTKVENNKEDELCKIGEGSKVEESKETETPQKESTTSPKDHIAATEVKETKEISEEAKKDSDVTDAQRNGSTTNGDAVAANVNGDANKEEELSSRLSVENGKEVVNGSNGDSVGEQGQGDNKVETEVSDIKVKTVAPDESRSEPIEQPTEA